MHRSLGGLDRIALVMDGRSRTGEIVYLIHFDKERERDVMAHQFEALMVQQMLDVVPGAGEVIVHAKDFVATRQQGLAQKRTNKPGPAGHQNALFQCLSPCSAQRFRWWRASSQRQLTVTRPVSERPACSRIP